MQLVEKDQVDIPGLGFVRLVDVMGSDDAIVEAARVSYKREAEKISSKSTRRLIRYLLRHRHTSPFEQAELKFHIEAPIFVERQWFRHRTASINSMSGRYAEYGEEFYRGEFRAQGDESNKQGSVPSLESESDKAHSITMYSNATHESYYWYQKLLELGVAREQARIVLPTALMTTWYWKIDLHNLLHFLELRLDSHAQEEIRLLAQAVAGFVKQLFPLTWEAFVDYRLEAHTFSRVEMSIVRDALEQLGSQLDVSRIEQKSEQVDFLAAISKRSSL